MHFFCKIFRSRYFSPCVSQEHLRKTDCLNLQSFFFPFCDPGSYSEPKHHQAPSAASSLSSDPTGDEGLAETDADAEADLAALNAMAPSALSLAMRALEPRAQQSAVAVPVIMRLSSSSSSASLPSSSSSSSSSSSESASSSSSSSSSSPAPAFDHSVAQRSKSLSAHTVVAQVRVRNRKHDEAKQ